MSLFTSYHNISHADGLFHGNSGYAPGMSKWLRDGQPITAPFRYDWDAVTPIAAKTANLVAATTWNTAQTLTALNGTLSSAGAAGAFGSVVMDVPRCLSYTTSTFATANTVYAYGTDYYGDAMSEQVGIPTSTANQTVNGKKAFKKVTCIAIQSVTNKGTLSVGVAAIFGLPFALAGNWDILQSFAGVTAESTNTSTIYVKADVTSPATALTGDTRGTYAPSTTAPNGSLVFRTWFTALGKDTRKNLYGVPQYGL